MNSSRRLPKPPSPSVDPALRPFLDMLAALLASSVGARRGGGVDAVQSTDEERNTSEQDKRASVEI